MTISDRLNEAMENAKITSQSALSRKSGVPQATISRILKGGGTKGPETDTLKKLALACGVTFLWLNEGTRAIEAKDRVAAPQQPDDNTSLVADQIIELVTAFKIASPPERKLLMRAARNVAGTAAGRKRARRV